MFEKVDFIGREAEIASIEAIIEASDKSRNIICLYGKDGGEKNNRKGGIGKTRLLEEVRERYLKNDLESHIVGEIIDFDDLSFRILQNINRKISEMLGQASFEKYFKLEKDYQILQKSGVSHELIKQTRDVMNQTFIECFNDISLKKRVVLFFDTTDHIDRDNILFNLCDKLVKMNNVAIIMAGRNADIIGIFLKDEFKEAIKKIELNPFSEDESRKYLKRKMEQLNIHIESDLAEKLIFLSDGKPILIDLAAEWRTRGISLEWLVTESIEQIKGINAEELKKRRRMEFERELVHYVTKIGNPMNRLILAMSHVYPLNIEMVQKLLNSNDINSNNIEEIFHDAKSYVFVKQLPNNYISLHDEMRRMLNDYIWIKIDPNNSLRDEYSRIIIKYFEKRIEEIEKENPDDRELFVLKLRYLYHILLIELDNGVKAFVKYYDKVRLPSVRSQLIYRVRKHYDKCSFEQKYIIDIKEANHLFEIGEYLKADELINKILDAHTSCIEHKIESLLLRANIKVRLGKVKEAFISFNESVVFSKEKNLSVWHIKSLNGLGWAYRLTGDIDNAIKHYHEARRLCQKEGGLKNIDLKETYSWLSNNLAFVLSYSHKTCPTAIDMITLTIQNWKSMGNIIGEGAAYLVLGIAYYRSDVTNKALGAFQKASDIFSPLKNNDWLGQIYSWRGALHQNIGNYDAAKEDLEKSLSICASNIKPMTLNRLARVYMSLNQWDDAEKYLEESLALARQLPDSMYWLGAIERLAIIASEKGEYQRLSDLEREFYECRKKIEHPEKNSLGMAYISLARLALVQNDINKIVNFFKEGIPLLVEYSTYARTGILRRLDALEKNFDKINPEIIRTVGKELQSFIADKEIEDVTYSLVSPIMDKWANWKGQNEVNEE